MNANDADAPAVARSVSGGTDTRSPLHPSLHSRAGLPIAAASSILFFACAGPRHALDAASTQARQVTGLWWIFFSVCVAVYAVILVLLLGAIARAQRRPRTDATTPGELCSVEPARESRLTRIVGGGVLLTTVILFGLLLTDFATGRTLQKPASAGEPPLKIKITGHQWWWAIEYEDPQPSNLIQTANELHLPRGRAVELTLNSADVIHSFWLPNLQGKKDLIPGYPTKLTFTPEREGTFRGQCAEFCGYQHAHMGLTAIVESPEAFAQWQEAQRRPAAEPATDRQRRGREVFLTTSCVLCHTIAGTPAASRVGPPLTHIASQQMLAANSFPNTRGYLAGWILDPQSLKPGTRMPQNLLSADDLHALVDYLEMLK